MRPANDFLILLVDDNPDLIDILNRASQRAFSNARFKQVHNTVEGKAYFRELEGDGPKLVLLDIDLQEKVDGLDFLAFLAGR